MSKPFAGAVAVHAGEQDLAGARVRPWLSALDRIRPVGLRPPWVKTCHEEPFFFASIATTIGLVADDARSFPHQLRVLHRGSVIDTLSARR